MDIIDVDKKRILIGILIGISSNLIGSVMYLYLVLGRPLSLISMVFSSIDMVCLVISMGAIPNLLTFFVLVNLKKINISRGIFLASTLTVLVVLVLKVFFK